jgi:hypothetical protein
LIGEHRGRKHTWRASVAERYWSDVYLCC